MTIEIENDPNTVFVIEYSGTRMTSVYCSQLDAIRSEERDCKKHNVSNEKRDERIKDITRMGRLMRADWAPPPCGDEVVWTRAAKERRIRSQ